MWLILNKVLFITPLHFRGNVILHLSDNCSYFGDKIYIYRTYDHLSTMKNCDRLSISIQSSSNNCSIIYDNVYHRVGFFCLLVLLLMILRVLLLLLELHHFKCRTFILQYHISTSTYRSEKPISSTTGNNN